MELLMYRSLNDAEAINHMFAPGNVKVWYYKSGRDLGMGMRWLKENNLVPAVDKLTDTHVMLGSITGPDLDQIFIGMQAENWSPMGQANPLLGGLGIRHTSMSVGDIIEVDGKFFFVDNMGFTELTA